MWELGPCATMTGLSWWIFPLLGLLVMAVMITFCAAMMRGLMGGAAMCGHRVRHSCKRDELGHNLQEPGQKSSLTNQ